MLKDFKKIAKSLLRELDREGFNDVPVDVKAESEGEWGPDYAIFIAEFDTDLFMTRQNEYVSFDSDKLMDDFRDHLYQTFGVADVVINHYGGCDEWEVCRKKPKPKEKTPKEPKPGEAHAKRSGGR